MGVDCHSLLLKVSKCSTVTCFTTFTSRSGDQKNRIFSQSSNVILSVCFVTQHTSEGETHILVDGAWAKIKTYLCVSQIWFCHFRHFSSCSSPFFLVILVLITKHSISKHDVTNPGYKGHITHTVCKQTDRQTDRYPVPA